MKTLNLPEQTYERGTHGPFVIDGLAAQEYLALDMTIVGWPNVEPLAIVSLAWEGRNAAEFTISGDQQDKNGNQKTAGTLQVSVPHDENRTPIQNSTGSFVMEVFAPFKTALTLRAV